MDSKTINNVSKELLGKKVCVGRYGMLKTPPHYNEIGEVIGFNKNGLVRIKFENDENFHTFPRYCRITNIDLYIYC